jgi:hypothetical protein
MEHLAPLHSRLSAVIVTTPQAVALVDTMKCLSFTRTVNLPLLGLIENMSGYVCPCCGEISNVFSTGGGEALATREGVQFLGALPIDPELVELLDNEAIAVSEAEKAEDLESEGVKSKDMTSEHTSEEHAFELLKRYQQTATHGLFMDMSTKAIARMSALDIQ